MISTNCTAPSTLHMWKVLRAVRLLLRVECCGAVRSAEVCVCVCVCVREGTALYEQGRRCVQLLASNLFGQTSYVTSRIYEAASTDITTFLTVSITAFTSPPP
jgi:hypothetical protein